MRTIVKESLKTSASLEKQELFFSASLEQSRVLLLPRPDDIKFDIMSDRLPQDGENAR